MYKERGGKEMRSQRKGWSIVGKEYDSGQGMGLVEEAGEQGAHLTRRGWWSEPGGRERDRLSLGLPSGQGHALIWSTES
jgi:hypothetical protein